MQVNINHADRTVEVWLGSSEKADGSTLDSLSRACKDKKYTLVTFHSGGGVLADYTANLLLRNK